MISTNSRIVVTGACGSVGSELVRRLLSLGHTVCALDQSEDGLFRLDQELNEIAEGRLRSFLGNIRDEYRLRMAFEGVDIVFHCAALKHVYLSEYNPFEAMQTNIEGSHNVIQAAIAADVDRVIFTSSDKAVNPTSTMGASKLLGERLFVSANHHAGKHKTRFSCVRFGNVLNSNGSVLTIFKRQLENGSPITITSKQMTRFFITMEQAVDLCLYAASEMLGGEIFVLNMGSNDIMTLARVVSGDESPEFIEIGVKPGEKLYEELVTENEAPRTVYDDHVYVVLPDTVDLMSDETRHEYSKYNDFPRLNAPLRSDQDLLTEEEVANILSFSSLI
ncbi:SDR family NAD(P)-dependent oxidoreductase [Thiohalophilus thiocyanatoxydans]|nr:SDR family NAD(P)-dependent oxidoreductase [Thiohalophilus thiocyanatoxydans]